MEPDSTSYIMDWINENVGWIIPAVTLMAAVIGFRYEVKGNIKETSMRLDQHDKDITATNERIDGLQEDLKEYMKEIRSDVKTLLLRNGG